MRARGGGALAEIQLEQVFGSLDDALGTQDPALGPYMRNRRGQRAGTVRHAKVMRAEEQGRRPIGRVGGFDIQQPVAEADRAAGDRDGQLVRFADEAEDEGDAGSS
jgi:hypothetical protein